MYKKDIPKLLKIFISKSQSARIGENFMQFFISSKCSNSSFGGNFSSREVKRRDGYFHNKWPLVLFWLGGGRECSFFQHRPIRSFCLEEDRIPAGPPLCFQLSDKGGWATGYRGHGDRKSLWLKNNSSAFSAAHPQRLRTDGVHLKHRVGFVIILLTFPFLFLSSV